MKRRQGVVSVLQLFDKRITKQQFKMKENKKFGFTSQGYEPPRAESVEMSNQGMLCASPIDGVTTTDYDEVIIDGSW